MNKIETEILIIGGGAAGLAAAVSASEKKVLIVDDNPKLGGQIWRVELGKIKSPEARELVEKIEQKQVSILNNATVFGQKEKQSRHKQRFKSCKSRQSALSSLSVRRLSLDKKRR